MKTMKYLLCVLAIGGMTTLAGAQSTAHPLKGWIGDSQCGASGHSKTCTIKCIKNGAKPVFVDSTNKVWSIDDPAAVQNYYGQHVEVVGTQNPTNNSIHINKVKSNHSM